MSLWFEGRNLLYFCLCCFSSMFMTRQISDLVQNTSLYFQLISQVLAFPPGFNACLAVGSDCSSKGTQSTQRQKIISDTWLFILTWINHLYSREKEKS